MGCASSGNKETTNVSAQRRRLSVGQVDNAQGGADTGGNDEQDRGTIAELNQQSIIDMLGDGEGRKMSIGTQTDQGKTSFANKSIQQMGDEIDLASTGYGYTCRKGLKPEAPNQDSWSILKLETHSIYAVFDGHGQKGHDVSNFVKENLVKLIIKDSRFKTDEDQTGQMLKDNFKKTQSLVATADRMKKLSAQMSGTTATLCVHEHGSEQTPFGKISIAHVADSTAVLGQKLSGNGSKPNLNAIQLTRDHKPNLKDERARIEKEGGRVVFDGYANHRVYAKNARYPGLNMSRCMGDLMGHADCGLTAEPEIKHQTLTAEDAYLLLCSDGVWEFLKPEEAVQIVSDFPAAKAMVAAERLAKEAWDRWIREEGGAVVDDITVVLVHLNQGNRDK